ncbi:MAG: NAD(P)/FAD-dependent oxidoreductase [Solirubrobacteraceae bacterium MAG38_C4-C5]|nr:NAD(P)/FAD-dependent oxidoreductase [Candidatus Siliceabacter maunaloa]
MSTNGARALSVVIVGAGFGGIAAAIELRRHGFRDITILEAAPRLGGTWLYNTYPGAACDVPSHLYSFSFAQRRDWPRLCSGQAEILAYLECVAHDYGVDGLVVCDTQVTACAWDDERAQWSVATARGHSYAADAIIIATGQLHQPAHPRIPGIETFAGQSFHSARWNHDVPLSGRRVAVVGTGASAVQLVPEVAEQAARLTVFQRTGNWLLPRRNRPYPPAIRTLIERVPGVQAFRRRFMFQYGEAITLAIRHPATIGRLLRLRSIAFMRWQLRDRELRRKVWPGYTFGCKRILFSSAFLPALQRPDVELVTEAVRAVRANGVVAADGTLHEADVLIYATGFKSNDFMFPMEVTGRDGRSLRDDWAAGAHAHLGITVPGYPSMFVLYGPNTNTSGGSIIAYLEAQAAYLRQALTLMRDHGAGGIEVRPEIEAASDRETQDRFRGTAWTRCDSWYRDEDGRIVANWPGYMREYLRATRELDPAQYLLTPAPRPTVASL